MLKIRKPGWADQLICNQAHKIEGDYRQLPIKAGQTVVRLALQTSVKQHTFAQKETYFSYGPLVYAFPMSAQAEKAKSFLVQGFFDWKYPTSDTYRYAPGQKAGFQSSAILIKVTNNKTQAVEQIRLILMSKTILRQVTF